MSLELWATYSVRDHLAHPKGRGLHHLAVDMVLFDRLVFPIPQVGIQQIGCPPDQPSQLLRPDYCV